MITIKQAVKTDPLGFFFAGTSYTYILEVNDEKFAKESTLAPEHFFESLLEEGDVQFCECYNLVTADTSFGASIIVKSMLS